jgi:hypothetical protein
MFKLRLEIKLFRNSRGENYNKSELYVRCKVCDGKSREEPKHIEDELAASTLESYLQLRFNKSPPVKKQVAGSLRRWSNHVPVSINFCFLNFVSLRKFPIGKTLLLYVSSPMLLFCFEVARDQKQLLLNFLLYISIHVCVYIHVFINLS